MGTPPYFNFGKLTLSLTLSALLFSSVITMSYAEVTYRHFTGSNYIEIPNSASLQLAQFTLEAKFRIADNPGDRSYLVSKASSSPDNVNLDHNYALYLTPSGSIGGGFQAANGVYYYVHSGAITSESWHVAKLVYDGSRLKLFVDGELKNSVAIVTKVDNAGTGSLKIGTNFEKSGNFFVGDLDYVKVMDRSTYKVKYYNTFDTSSAPIGSSPPPEPDPDPEPEPTPTPTTTGDCADKAMSQMRGVAFMDPILTRTEKGASVSAPDNYVKESFERLKSYGFNLVRVQYYWESYVYKPTEFMARLDQIATTADQYDICVVFDNHHWFTSSYWNTDIGMSGRPVGFPSFVVKYFPSKTTYEQTAAPFWNALLSNSLVIDGRKIWDIQAEFLTKVVNRVDKYDSVAGYEILNEPHLWSKDQYDKLGNYHTYMAEKIRAISDKKIIFNRETAHGFMRDPTLEYKVVPRGVDKLVYGPHLYTAPTDGSGGEKQVEQIKKWKQEWGVEIMMGEFSAHSQTDMTAFLKAWKDGGFGWTYWKWSKATSTRSDHLGNVVYESDTIAKTEALKWLLSSYNTIY